MSGLIAIVGRPNVGKSALFNRIAGRRIAIVHDQPGVTRDRVSAEIDWRGRSFTLVDTGGIGLRLGETTGDSLTRAVLDQVQVAIDAAQALILVVDAQEGIMPLDSEVAAGLRRAGTPVIVAANKIDNAQADPQAADFARLGFDQTYPVSAIHNRGIDALVEAALAHLPHPDPARTTERSDPPLKLAIVGRPNVGKSSLLNALTKSQRVIVSPVPGTTRDSVDVPFEMEIDGVRQRYILIDTAGIRKRRRVDDSVEFFSVQRAEESIRRSDIVIFVLDAESGILEQDKKIADRILEAHRACVLVVNKWDLFEAAVSSEQAKEQKRSKSGDRRRGAPRTALTLADFGAWVQKTLFFLDYAPVIFTSTQSGFHLDRLLESVRYVASQLRQKLPTSLVNRTLRDALDRKPPTSSSGHHLKFFYATQTAQDPPTFALFVNRPELLSDQYRKYLANEFRRAFGYEGCPLLFDLKARPREVSPIRSRRN